MGYGSWSGFGGGMMPWFGPSNGALLGLLIVWSLAWKGMALWKAARAGHKPWFVALLILNTAGILDILYLYVFSKPSAPAIPEKAAGDKK